MGFALPAIGAKMGMPDRKWLCYGDGGFQMTIQEWNYFQTKVPVKMSYLMSFLGMVRQWQQLFFDKRYFY
jgi:acetolactate synthase-1/2/3 large subunit